MVCCSKSYLIFIIITVASVISTILMYRRSTTLISELNRKGPRHFQCRSRWKMFHVKPFYQVDCNNPFLKALVKTTDDKIKADVCNSFNPLYTQIPTMIRSFKRFQMRDFDVLQRACPQCHHLQVIDGKLYDVPRPAPMDYETRSKSVKTLFNYVVNTFDGIPNMELLIHVGDWVEMKRNLTHPSKCPVFGFGKNKNTIRNNTHTDGIVSIPCFSFWNWPEAGITRWNKKMISIKQASDKKSFDERIDKLFWRGARTGYRGDFVNLTGKHRNLMDVSFMEWQGSKFHPQYRTLEQHCDYKYLLHLEGNTFSGRLKYLLLCSSPVIFAQIDGWEEFWYHLLKHQENIIILNSRDEAQLLNMTSYLLTDSERASRIGINGQNIILKYLNEQAIICYIRNVLLAYSKLIDYQVTKHEKATDKFLVTKFS
jgi:hypothetical protein